MGEVVGERKWGKGSGGRKTSNQNKCILFFNNCFDRDAKDECLHFDQNNNKEPSFWAFHSPNLRLRMPPKYMEKKYIVIIVLLLTTQ